MRITRLAILTLFLLPLCNATAETSHSNKAVFDLPTGLDAAEQTIQAPGLLSDVSIVAGDEFEGRGPGSEGDRKAREFLANRLSEMGFSPLFEGRQFVIA